MAKNASRCGRWHWLMPLGFALPALAAAAYLILTYGPKIRDYLSIAIKMVVIS